MTHNEIHSLERGDIVRHKNGDSYIVLEPHGGRVIAIREIQVSNPEEWELVRRGTDRRLSPQP